MSQSDEPQTHFPSRLLVVNIFLNAIILLVLACHAGQAGKNIAATVVECSVSFIAWIILVMQIMHWRRTQEQRLQRGMAELQHATQAIQESEERYRTFVQNSSEAIWRFELEQPISIGLTVTEQIEHLYRFAYLAECNDAMAKMYGLEQAQELVGVRLGELLIQSDPDNTEHLAAFILSGYRIVDLETVEYDIDDNLKYFRNNLIGILEANHIVWVWGSQTDITERKVTEVAKRQSESRYRLLFENNPLPMWVYSPTTLEFLAVNDAAVMHYGYSRDEFLAMTIAEIRPSEDIPQMIRSVAIRLSSEKQSDTPWRHRKKDGTIIEVEITSTVIPFDDQDAVIVTATDITLRRHAESATRAAEERYRSIFENAIEGIFRSTPQGRYLNANPALARIYGYDSPDDLIAQLHNIGDQLYVLPKQRQDFMHLMERQDVVSDFESQIYRRDGSIIWISENTRAVRDAAGTIAFYEGTVENITERKVLEEQREAILAEALERADHDPLTGLLNHRAFHKRFEEEADRTQRKGSSLCIAVMDLDNFKFFNDVYGHSVGDEILQRVAAALQGSCRSYDIVARFGGDEFAVLLPGVTEAEIPAFISRLHAALKAKGYRPPGHDTEIPINLSVGAAIFPADAASRMETLELADDRLRRNKATGGNAWSQVEQVRTRMTQSVEGFSMLDALVAAVDNKDRYTRRHSEDVMTYAVEIARAMSLTEETVQIVEVAALLHDVGKIGVPDAILRKPGHLTDSEFEAVRQHPLMGAVIVGAVAGFEDTLDAVRHHHERWDGLGYPGGLRGQETPLLARLLAVADAFSAMTTDRPYRSGMPPEKALAILESGAGTQWDPACVTAFLSVRRKPCLLVSSER